MSCFSSVRTLFSAALVGATLFASSTVFAQDGASTLEATKDAALSAPGDLMNSVTSVFQSDSLKPLVTQAQELLPRLGAALAILIVGYIIAWIISFVVGMAIRKTGLNKMLGKYFPGKGGRAPNAARPIAKAVFWVLMMFVAIACLQALQLDAVSEPLTGLLNQFFEFLPNAIGAAVMFAVAWLVATVAKIGSSSALEATNIDSRLNLEPGTLTKSLPVAAFSFILLFFLPGVLDALGIDSLSGPVKGLVTTIMDFLPMLLTAAIVLTIFLFVGKLAGNLISSLLTGVGFDDMPAKAGLDTSAMSMTPSNMAGKGTLGIIGLIGAIQAIDILQLDVLSGIVSEVGDFALPVLLGCVLLGVGFWLSNMAKKTILASGMDNKELMAKCASGAILVMTGLIALKKMNLAGDMVDQAFGLTLGAAAVAAAIAFGWGGRDVAKKWLEKQVG